ncbi:hypothetical protein [Alkalilimnicola ehrlichii]|uniref:TraD/TraG TraM recognition site domain-containing protein n=1 Tax=Alkalilimnicola ehrlichii TaxID=351052 RepID=A0A3E0WHA2_9GAMM|nr:hypothetical protein [Alkalilimnicola ehrlichii]RFA31551.1 hypothetical protein CAL65_22285 [Alkalilimnicola ehrlichii]
MGTADDISDPSSPRRVPRAVIPRSVFNYGILLLGGMGAGKTVSGILGFLYAHFDGPRDRLPEQLGAAVFDGKGELDMYRRSVGMGATPDYFFSSELPDSHSINLMAGTPEDVVDRCSRLLIGTTTSTTYYSDQQRAVLTFMVPLLAATGQPYNARDLYASLAVDDAGWEVYQAAERAGADPFVLSMAKNFLSQDFQDRVQLISGLLNRLLIFVHGPYAARLNAYQPDIDIPSVVSEQKYVFFHLPYTAFARDVGIALVEMFASEARRRQISGTGNQLYPLLLDDWGKFFMTTFPLPLLAVGRPICRWCFPFSRLVNSMNSVCLSEPSWMTTWRQKLSCALWVTPPLILRCAFSAMLTSYEPRPVS